MFLVPRGCVIFLSQEVAGFFCPKRSHDFFFVSRGCVIFFCPERLRDFFTPWVLLLFFLSRDVA